MGVRAAQHARGFYVLGQVPEKSGDKANAILNCTKFPDLWNCTDAGLPGLADARNHVAALK